MHLIWNASPEIVSIGPIVLRWYGLLFATGFIIAAMITGRMFQRVGQSVDTLDTLVGWMIAGTIIGARLGHTLIYEPEVYLNDPIRILKIWEGGLASHGGTLGAMLAAWLWNRKYREGSYLTLLDLLSVPTAFVTGMIRLGNFFNSEILGHPSNFPLAIVFKRVDMQPRHPAMLYESFSYFCTFALLRWMFRAGYNRKPGLLFGTFMCLLFGSRFFIEYVKEVQVASETGMALDYGQLLSIPFVILGLVLIFRSRRVPEVEPIAHVPTPAADAGTSRAKKEEAQIGVLRK